MNQIITITVDLMAEDRAKQIEEAIGILEMLNAAPSAPAAPATITPVAPAAVAPAATTAPVAPAAPAAPAVPAIVELDSEKLPWDVRIDSPSKKKLVKDGTWKLKRGVDPALVETVKAELRATMAAAPVAEAELRATMAAAPTADASSVSGGESPSLPETPMQFPEFMQAITERMTSGALIQDDINVALLQHAIPSLPMLASRPDLIPVIAAELGVA